MYHYSATGAKIYSEIGIVGTTYQAGFEEMGRLLGNLAGKTVLDYGSGTGRSAIFTKSLGAKRVIAVEQDQNMIDQFRLKAVKGIDCYKIANGKVPLKDISVDVTVSAHVINEIETIEQITQAFKEIVRVLKTGGKLIIVTTNPLSIGYDYLSYRYKKRANLKSGDSITCVIKGSQPFEIKDIFWTEKDIKSALVDSGFDFIETDYPTEKGDGWLDETKVAPDVVFTAIKS